MLIAISGHDRFLAVFLPESECCKTRQDDLFNSAQFYKTYRLNLHSHATKHSTANIRNKIENVTSID